MRSLNKYILTIAILLFLSKVASGQSVDEYTLKAIWIGKFPHFIDWPSYKSNSSETFNIATISKHPIIDKLEVIYKDHQIWNKPVRIIHLDSFSKIDSTIHIIYIPELNSNSDISNMVEDLQNKGILLISDSKGYAELGVHINFFFDDHRIRFEINESSIKSSDFFVSYRLLNIAKIIEPVENE